ncbi:MAG: DUF6011 domain-containing protein [Chloroflexi bacterium]|jgi:hypothetical protein|nr:DUF6011 domain-containing protein [Chloroflexota bacterium]
MNPTTTAAPTTTNLCRDIFAGHPESIVGLAGGATCDRPVRGLGWMCDEHGAMARDLLSTVISDVPDEREQREVKAAEAMDPALRARLDEARRFLNEYTGRNGFLLTLRADRRFGTKHFRVTEKMAEAILRVRDNEAATTVEQPRLAEALVWLVANRTTDHFAASVHEGFQRYGRLTAGQYAAVLRNVDRVAREQQAPAEQREPAGEGWYKVGDDIYKVQKAVHGSGRLYAKRLDVPVPGIKGEWVYAPGVVNTLTVEQRLTEEQAREFGRLYGVCCCCGAVLTDEDSIENGIGPVCASKAFRG